MPKRKGEKTKWSVAKKLRETASPVEVREETVTYNRNLPDTQLLEKLIYLNKVMIATKGDRKRMDGALAEIEHLLVKAAKL